MTQKKIITVRPDGTAEFVYDDQLRELMQQGEAKIRRASHVEPWEELSEAAVTWLSEHRGIRLSPGEELGKDWWADMLPSGGGVLGPFATHQEALDAEVEWINENVLTEKAETACP